MKKSFKLILSAVFLLSLMTTGVTAAQTEKKNINLDTENIKKAAKVVEQNRALFNDPELLQKFGNLSRNLKKKS